MECMSSKGNSTSPHTEEEHGHKILPCSPDTVAEPTP